MTQPPTGKRLRPEDHLLYEALAIARGEKPATSVRHQFAGYDGARRGGSVNHADLAAGAKAAARETDGAEIEEQCREETDWGLCEPWSRNEYGRWSACGKLLYLRASNSATARRWLEHFWAGMILLSTDPENAARNLVGMPGARSGKRGFHGVGWPEWLLALSRDAETPELRKKSNGQRNGPDAFWPEDYSTQLCLALRDEIRATAAPVWQAFRAESFRGVLRFYRYGTRVGYRIRRTDRYLAAVLEKNCNGNTPPTWAFLHSFATGRSEWFPDTDERIRQDFDSGSAALAADQLVATSEFFGTYQRPLPDAALVYDVRTHPAGVTLLAGQGSPSPPVAPASTLSARLENLDGGRFLLLATPSVGRRLLVRKIHPDAARPQEERYVVEDAPA